MCEVTTCAEVIFRFKERCVSSVDGTNQGRSVRLVYAAGKKSCCAEDFELSHSNLVNRGAQLFEGLLALNPGLNLTRVSLSCVEKYFL